MSPLFDFATRNLHLATNFYHLVAKWRLNDFVNFKPCSGETNVVETCYMTLLVPCNPPMSRIECNLYCLISTSYLAELFDIFILLRICRQNCVCFGDFLPMRTLCDAYLEEFESH